MMRAITCNGHIKPQIRILVTCALTGKPTGPTAPSGPGGPRLPSGPTIPVGPFTPLTPCQRRDDDIVGVKATEGKLSDSILNQIVTTK